MIPVRTAMLPLLLAPLPLAACSASQAQSRSLPFDAAPAAVPEAEPHTPVEIVRIPDPLPLNAPLLCREAVALGVEHFEIGGAACLVAKLREPGTLGQRGD